MKQDKAAQEAIIGGFNNLRQVVCLFSLCLAGNSSSGACLFLHFGWLLLFSFFLCLVAKSAFAVDMLKPQFQELTLIGPKFPNGP